ncbi:MAG: OprO/OprP family phosphate-selective porin [Rariglobus sp.]|nr:porin [Rariglobus sp.]
MRTLTTAVRTALATTITAVGLTASLSAQTASASDIEALREQIRLLDQKLRVLERNTELKDETATAAAKTAGKVAFTDKGLTFSSGDGANSLRVRGLVQADSRWFANDHVAANDTFILRRARLILEGAFNKNFEYLITPEFAGTTPSIVDAFVNVKIRPEFQIRAGRFREPVGLEQLQSDAVAFFNERSVVSSYLPNRDVGIQIHGDLFTNRLNYAVGYFNGVEDGQNGANSDNSNEKDFAARLFATPFINNKDSALAGLGFGVGASAGSQNGSSNGTLAYRTDGQQTWFSYNGAGTPIPYGNNYRISPQAYYYYGPFGLLAEYAVTSAEWRNTNGTNRRNLQNTAYQIAAGYVLTGEDAGYKGVTPRTNFDLDNGTWGAFEVVARFSQADVDSGAFTGATPLAVRTSRASGATGYGLGLNWYLSKTVRAGVDYFHTSFDVPAGVNPAINSPIDGDENVFITRLQIAF